MGKAEKISTGLVATLAIAAGSVACGGGEGSNASTDSPSGTRIELTQSPFSTPIGTDIVTPLPTATESPTIAPTPEPTEKPAIPTFEEMTAKVDSAVLSFGSSILPDPLQSVEKLQVQIDLCNEIGLENVIPENYGTLVLGGCSSIGEGLVSMYKVNPTPEIKDAIESARDYTLGSGGKFDQLYARDPYMQLITDPSAYKAQIKAIFFTIQ